MHSNKGGDTAYNVEDDQAARSSCTASSGKWYLASTTLAVGKTDFRRSPDVAIFHPNVLHDPVGRQG